MSIDLYNGDCLEVMQNLIDKGIKVDAIITDPPYGTTRNKWDAVIPFDKMWSLLNNITNDNTPICLFGDEPFSSVLRLSNTKEYRYDWKWKKSRPTGFLNANKMPLKNIEDILVFYKKLPTYNPQFWYSTPYTCGIKIKSKNYGKFKRVQPKVMDGRRFPTNTIEIPSVSRQIHPTQKPVALLEYLVKTYTNEGDTVLDFTMGSGTTGVACKKLNRNFIGIELDKHYFEIAKKRIEETQSPE